MAFSKLDKKYMNIAIKEAKKSLNKGNYPVGAVLIIEGKLIGKIGNSMSKNEDWISHAENNLIKKCSKIIKKICLPTIKDKSLKKVKIELFTTLEPCLMCLGTSILNRVSRIVFTCPDPHGGATKIKPKDLPEWYQQKWPKIEGGLEKEQSFELLIKYMKKQPEEYWKKTLKLFEQNIK
ncbi:MAG: deaminase [Candidatus Pacearchaeota archaeon]|nr:deaminase [Candidatus Pacearchaeota archaeon]